MADRARVVALDDLIVRPDSSRHVVHLHVAVPHVDGRVGVVRGQVANTAYTRMQTVTDTGYICQVSCFLRESD